jgi:hypothetical protein
MVGTILGYIFLEILSLLTSFVVSFFTWGFIAIPPGGGGPGDGIGFILVLMVGIPIWVIFAFFTPQEVHNRLVGTSKRFLRIAISFFAPVIAALITTAIISLLIRII